jgi:dipeptidyl aminopeptidase/acylaminoacyl peptidase
MTLQGWIYKPAGKGPFPAVLYNHGSDKAPGWFPTLGKYWTSKGYVFFVPHRRGHGRSPGSGS